MQVAWTPWGAIQSDPSGTHRAFLIVSGHVSRVELSPPHCELPCVWRTETQACFELPTGLPRLEREPPQQVTVHLVGEDRSVGETHTLQLTGGVSRPGEVSDSQSRPSDQVSECEGDTFSSLLEQVIACHVESMSEITFPQRATGYSPLRAEGRTIVGWPDFDRRLWAWDDRDAPMRLIVRIADSCRVALESICRTPRRILRRERQLERIDRVQQMDDACIRWFVRQPGRTILEKAGRRQRVLGVVRLESVDTPENRVIHDFLRRCLRAANAYMREVAALSQQRGQSYGDSYRAQLVRRFRQMVRQWLRTSALASVPLPAGVPRANYVLQYDRRYSEIWEWYVRLRRQQESEDEVWRWQHRLWAEHMGCALLHALHSQAVDGLGFAGKAYLHTDPHCGHFFDDESVIGCWINGRDGPSVVYSVPQQQLCQAAESLAELGPLTRLGPDWVIVARRDLTAGPPERILAVWTALGFPADDRNALREWLGELAEASQGQVDWSIVTPAIIAPVGGGTGASSQPRSTAERHANVYGIGVRVPIPVASALDWFCDQVGSWVSEGIL